MIPIICTLLKRLTWMLWSKRNIFRIRLIWDPLCVMHFVWSQSECCVRMLISLLWWQFNVAAFLHDDFSKVQLLESGTDGTTKQNALFHPKNNSFCRLFFVKWWIPSFPEISTLCWCYFICRACQFQRNSATNRQELCFFSEKNTIIPKIHPATFSQTSVVERPPQVAVKMLLRNIVLAQGTAELPGDI